MSGEIRPTKRLADLWRSQFTKEIESRRKQARDTADRCKQGGWYRGQIEQQVALYDVVLAALSKSTGSQS